MFFLFSAVLFLIFHFFVEDYGDDFGSSRAKLEGVIKILLLHTHLHTRKKRKR